MHLSKLPEAKQAQSVAVPLSIPPPALTQSLSKPAVVAAHAPIVPSAPASDVNSVALEHFNTGVKYCLGNGVPQDYAEGMQCLRKAADQGYASAQYNIGVMYHKGMGMPQHFGEAMAVAWYHKG